MPATVASARCSTASASPSRPRGLRALLPHGPERPARRAQPCGHRAGRVGRLGRRSDGPRAPGDRGLGVGFRARDRAQVDAFWQADSTQGTTTTASRGHARSTARRTTAGPARPDGDSVAVHADRGTPCPTATSTTCGSTSATRRPRGASSRRSPRTPAAPGARRARSRAAVRPGLQLLARPGRAAAHRAVHLAFPHARGLHGARVHAAVLAAGYEDHGTRASARSTTRATTARSCSTRTGTASRSSATTGAEPWPTSPPTASRPWASRRSISFDPAERSPSGAPRFHPLNILNAEGADRS